MKAPDRPTWLPRLTLLVGVVWLGLILLALGLHGRHGRIQSQAPGQVVFSGGPYTTAELSPPVMRTRSLRHDQDALAYARSVQQAVQAYLKDHPSTQRLAPGQRRCVQTDYHAGTHHAVALNAAIVQCQVTLDASGGVRVTVIYLGGTRTQVQVGD